MRRHTAAVLLALSLFTPTTIDNDDGFFRRIRRVIQHVTQHIKASHGDWLSPPKP